MKLDRIRALRTDKDLSSDKLASKLDISGSSLLRYERRERTIPVELLIEIANYFDVSVDSLLERTNNKKMNK